MSFNLLVYGASGVGKTVLVGSTCEVPELCPAAFLDCESGAMSIRTKGYGYDDRMQIIRISDTGGLQQVCNTLTSFKTVVIDGLFEAHFMFTERVCGTKPPEGREWYGITFRFKRFLRLLLLNEVSFIATCHERSYATEINGAGPVTLQMPGALREDLVKMFDIVGRLVYTEPQTGVQEEFSNTVCFRGTNTFRAKDRSGLLGASMVNPNMVSIYDKLRGIV